MEQIHTDVWSLRFLIKGKRLCFITRTPQGKEKRYWVDLTSTAHKAIMKEISEHLAAKAVDAALTPQQLAEKYAESGGGS